MPFPIFKVPICQSFNHLSVFPKLFHVLLDTWMPNWSIAFPREPVPWDGCLQGIGCPVVHLGIQTDALQDRPFLLRRPGLGVGAAAGEESEAAGSPDSRSVLSRAAVPWPASSFGIWHPVFPLRQHSPDRALLVSMSTSDTHMKKLKSLGSHFRPDSWLWSRGAQDKGLIFCVESH